MRCRDSEPSSGMGSTALESTLVNNTTITGREPKIAPAHLPLRRSTCDSKAPGPPVQAPGSVSTGIDGSFVNEDNGHEAVVQPPLRRSTRIRNKPGHSLSTGSPLVASSSPVVLQSPASSAAVLQGEPLPGNTLQRVALNHARSMREGTPLAVPQTEPAPGFSTPKRKYDLLQAHTLNTQVQGTPYTHTTRTGTVKGDGVDVTKKQLGKELKPVSYCYPKHVTTLYRNLATDEDIDEFLLGSQSGFTVEEQPVEEGSDGESGSVEESEVNSEVTSEQERKEGYEEESDTGSDEGGSSERLASQQDERVAVEDETQENESVSEEQAASDAGNTSTSPPPGPRGRWDDMPQPAALECLIYPNLIKIIVRIQEHFSKPAPPGVTRTVVDCSAQDFKHKNHQNTRPDVVICATGPSFEVPKAENPEEHLGGKKSSQSSLQNIGYTNTAAVIEVKRDSANDTDWDNVAQVGMYCR